MYGNKFILEEAKTPPRTIYNHNTLIKSSNLLERLPNISRSKPANPTRSNAGQLLIQNVRSLYSDAITSNKRYRFVCGQHTERNKNERCILYCKIKGGRIHLKLFPGAKSKQLNHYVKSTLDEYKYDSAIIHVGINDIL